ncbi:MAG: GNAT family protein [Ornithinibacter sp.]
MSPDTMTVYEITVAGHLDDHWSERLAGLRVARRADGATLLTGPLADQAQLHGVICGLRDIGAVLLSVRPVRPDGVEPGTTPVTPPALGRTLSTARLSLRPAVAADADATWALRRLAAVGEGLTGCPTTIDGYRAQFVEPARLAGTVVIRLGHEPDGEVIGDLMLRREAGWAQIGPDDAAGGVQAELGGVLDPSRTGHGYASEALRELIRYCVEELGVRRLVASCFLDDTAYWRFLERLGMRRESHAVRGALHRSGRWLDTVGYALLAEEFGRHR